MRIVITGLGGQGAVLLTRVITAAAHLEGKAVISTETHGMAQRGASVISYIKLGDYLSPLIRQGTADWAFSLQPSESSRAITYLAREATLFLNSASCSLREDAKRHVETNGIRIRTVDADKEAAAHGNARGANLFLLGFAIPFLPTFVKLESIREAIRKILRPQLWDINLRIIDQAHTMGKGIYEEDLLLRTKDR